MNDDEIGAVDLDSCPYKRPLANYCRCDVCRKCGFRKHTAIHAPVYGEPPGSKPLGHRFEAKE